MKWTKSEEEIKFGVSGFWCLNPSPLGVSPSQNFVATPLYFAGGVYLRVFFILEMETAEETLKVTPKRVYMYFFGAPSFVTKHGVPLAQR